MIRLIPAVRKLELLEGSLNKKSLRLVGTCPDSRLCKALEKLPQAADGTPVEITCQDGPGEGYTLDVTADAITI
jgi:hypothetical protein